MPPLPSRRTPYSLLALLIGLVVAIAGLAYGYHATHRQALTRQVRNQLLAIADTKVKHIAAWRADKLADARMMLGDPLLLAGLERLVTGRGTAAERGQISDWLDALCREPGYAGVTLADARGAILMRRGRLFGSTAHISSLARETAAQNDPTFTDLHLERGAPVHLGLNVPLRIRGDATAFGVLLAGLDPEDELFPLLRRWPTPSPTAESMLVRRDGEEAIFLSPLRKRLHAVPALRIPLEQRTNAAARAVAGEEGAFEARDYHGDAVFAAAMPVAGTNWLVVTKIDAEEVMAPLRSASSLMGVLAILLIFAAAARVWVLWRRNELNVHRARYQSELQRQEAAERYDAERKLMNGELQNATAALQSSESRFRAAFEQAAVGMNEVSLGGRFLRVNQRFCEITGYSHGELLRLTYSDITHPEDRAKDRSHVEAVLSGEVTSERWRKRYLRPDGAMIWVAVTASLLRDPAGELYMLGVVEDITAAVQAQESLQQTKERFRELVEHAPDGILVTSGEEIRYLNPAAVRLFGAGAAAQLTGAPVLDRVSADDRSATAEELVAVVAGAPAGATERRFVRVNGEAFAVEVSATAIEYDGQPSALVFLRDLADRKRAEEERSRLEQRLRQAQKMESVGRLAGGVAHDFNNHLTVINGYCDMLLDALAPDDPLREDLTEIRAAGDRAAGLTQQLLAFSRRQVVEARPLVLNDVIEEFCRMVRRLIGDDIEVRTELDPGLGCVLADRGQMHQVLMNLAVNARDAMPGGGLLVLGTENIELDGRTGSNPDGKPGSYVVLTVRDNGSGMSPETLQKIFEPFFTTKPMGVGTGLGLATVYGIVEQSGGFVRVASELNEGTTFRIYLPRIPEIPEAVKTPASGHEDLRGSETVLVVEDQSDVRKLATGVLRKNGYHVIEASSGPDALTAAASFGGPIELLVTDVVMPGMNGRELAQRLGATRPAIRVLYMSGYSGDVLAREGVVAFLPKPFGPADLAAKVREVMRTA